MATGIDSMDSSTTLSTSQWNTLYNTYDVRFIARYLNPVGVTWGLTANEAKKITSHGMSVVSLYEYGASSYTSGYFTYSQGTTDANNALNAMQNIGQPSNTPMYFCVDFCPTTSQISAVKSYFEGIN